MTDNNKEKTPTYKRVLALAGIVLLVGMYVALFVLALVGSPATFNLFVGCVAATVAIPIMLWLLIWVIGAMTGRHTIASLDAMTSNKQHDKYGNVIPEGKIDTVVFDIGNVLGTFVWREFIKNKGYDEQMTDRIAKASVLSEDWVEFDKGNLTTRQIAEKFAENDPEIAGDLLGIFTDLNDIIEKREETVPWIRSLKAAGYRVYYLSNFSKEALEGNEEPMAFISECDGGILSYREHVVKPDPAIYNLLASRYDLVPEKTVFIDDTKVNIDAARSLGWNGIVYESYEQVVKDLHNLGVRY
ncbi:MULTISPECIES: HAD family hydrolase [unclassified Butyrivibrio]|uniref:HAD family hydrolase n=1 Tax=unclassified Butyrivibrio TaxID=2639466 RepID=UPI0003B48DF8|nr:MULTISPECIES: HAD family phosphatase [unclassified Butyrivibrio]MDC7294710.1 HAD family phosphatase [Butyrivibrio sp. DSM 10294]